MKWLYSCLILFIFSCKNVHEIKQLSVLEIECQNAYGQWIFVEGLTRQNDSNQWKDSVLVKDRVQQVRFSLPDSMEAIYRVYSTDHRIDFAVVNDIHTIKVQVDYFNNGKFDFLQSPANIALQDFLQSIKSRAVQNREQYKKGMLNDSTARLKDLEIQQQYRYFVDTVSNPASALYIYSLVDFGMDRSGLKTFISRLANRFPEHPKVQELYRETIDFLKIFEEELEVGEKAPDINLPDTSGKIISLSSLKGKYLLLDFWASWDPVSRVQQQYNRRAFQKYSHQPFAIYSVSLDPEVPAWKSAIISDKLTWIQVNDPKVWSGAAARQYKLDSIPFNFLINPDGVIIGKAMYRDSLLIKLDELLK